MDALSAAKLTRERAEQDYNARVCKNQWQRAEIAGGSSLNRLKITPSMELKAVQGAQQKIMHIEAEVATECRRFQASGRSYFDASATSVTKENPPQGSQNVSEAGGLKMSHLHFQPDRYEALFRSLYLPTTLTLILHSGTLRGSCRHPSIQVRALSLSCARDGGRGLSGA